MNRKLNTTNEIKLAEPGAGLCFIEMVALRCVVKPFYMMNMDRVKAEQNLERTTCA
jgi:hypothetical protein